MIAYNLTALVNLFTRKEAAEAFHYKCLDKEELDLINSKYPTHFYSPNFFIRVGLFILTTVILLFSFGLFALLFLSAIEHVGGGLAILFALISYAALEYMVQTKMHFRSGVDDALLWISAGTLFGGVCYLANSDALANCLIVFIISLYCSLRFADKLMGGVWYVSLLGTVFFTCARLGPAAKALMPFVMMAVSAGTYFLTTKANRLKVSWLYSDCLQTIRILALLSFYFAGNYYVVRELSNSMFNLNLAENQAIPLGWFFWIFTMVIPFSYIARGIQKRDIVLIRVGLLLVAAIIFTIRYYYSVAAIEVLMTAGGIVLVLLSSGLNRYLKTAKYGFTNLDIAAIGTNDKSAIESVLLAQTFAGQAESTEGINLGGGSFGGGGASGEF